MPGGFRADGGGHASGHWGFIHVGAGAAERANIRIQWPGGESSPSYRDFPNTFVLIRKGGEAAQC
ncbi:hypothetical protein K1W69_02700 [Hoeflea sp. WL0058]|uniref:ASPIC/UnbV domain-containing protein n=1 Tax=Flavimaribacter sediminis TaxID=2865987 RepID=A0AAE3CZL5_9HYPH|nr:hypothetical protein [Flavimaribacter sediminis]MBW8636082.1 hypothetical protein [Flavimaribacter sediminis]